MDELGLRAGGGAVDGDAVVPHPDDRAARRRERRRTPPTRCCSSTWPARWNSDLSPDLRFAIALSINRQDLVNQQVSWAVPGIEVADSHVYVQGQADYKPAPTPASRRRPCRSPTSSTSTTVIGAGGSVNFPVTPVPAQAAAFIQRVGLVRTGDPTTVLPLRLRRCPSRSTWSSTRATRGRTSAAPVIRDELEAAGTRDHAGAGAERTAGGGGAGGGLRRPGRAAGHVHART